MLFQPTLAETLLLAGGPAADSGDVLDLDRVSTTIGDYLKIASPTGLDFTGDFSLGAWVKLPSGLTNGFYSICTRWGASAESLWIFEYRQATGVQSFRFALRGDSSNNGIWEKTLVVATDAWTHVGVSFDLSEPTATQVEMVINGSSVGNPTVVTDGFITGLNSGTLSEYRIGARDASSLHPWPDRLDQVLCWDFKKTSWADYNSVPTGSESNLQSAHLFEGGGTWLDETVNNNDMTGVGTPTTVSGDPAF